MTLDAHGTLPLTPPQLRVLRLVARVYGEYGEPPTTRWLARRLGVTHRAVQDHLAALYRRGWLRSPSPAGLRCAHVPEEVGAGEGDPELPGAS